MEEQKTGRTAGLADEENARTGLVKTGLLEDRVILNGLSQISLLMTCMVSFRPKQRTGPFLNFLGAPMIL
jgi:hypothetical protein